MRSIIVTGYDRSGTSYVASVLDHLGVNMGSNWRKADEANEAGYFENQSFVEANQAILERGETPDFNKIYNKYKTEIWGCKDPRFVHTMKYWKHIFEEPHIVIVLRNPVAIAKSVCFRDNGKYSPKKEFEHVMEDIFEYYTKIPRLLCFPHFFYSFEDRPDRELAEFLGLEWKEHKLYKPNLKHF